MDVAPDGGVFDGYELKLNSYDIGVDIELADAIRLIRFGHPEVSCVVITGGVDGVFCAGANIGMLASVDHTHKINFCKFTNETRLEIEDASANSGIRFLAAVDGACSGGGYELALACDHIMLIDDRSTAVSLPEVPLLGVLPGTGGLTRLTDKRGVRRDLADVFTTRSEGSRGAEALRWGLVDELAPRSTFEAAVLDRASALAQLARSEVPRRSGSEPVVLPEFSPVFTGGNGDHHSSSEPHSSNNSEPHSNSSVSLEFVTLACLPSKCSAELVVRASDEPHWLLQTASELDAVLCHLRFNEPELTTLVIGTCGDAAALRAWDAVLTNPRNHAERETALLWARTLRRLDLTSRSVFTTVEPGSCCVGVLAELALAADRTYMLDGAFEDPRMADAVGVTARGLAAQELTAQSVTTQELTAQSVTSQRPEGAGDTAIGDTTAFLQLTQTNLGAMPMSNGISRLESRLWGNPTTLAAAQATARPDTRTTEPDTKTTTQMAPGRELDAAAAAELGLVTSTPDELDWDDELRLAVEERAAFSGDALTALEANHRFCGPETMATKIFGRLSAWQNWIFSRPNAAGPNGALKRYGTGTRPDYDQHRA